MKNVIELFKKYLKENEAVRFGNLEYENELPIVSSTELSLAIASFAHIGQYRVNGEEYIVHPINVMHLFDKMIGGSCELSNHQIQSFDLPYYGVREVAALHDVIEDTLLTIEDVGLLFKEYGYHDYFLQYIKEPLLLITHDKSQPYDEYITIVMKHKVSALVKMLDLNDNLIPITLDELNSNNYDRCVRYLSYIKRINDEFRFIEKADTFRKTIHE